MAEQHPAPIPTPPDFPVTWERPEDESLFWHPDVMHFPEQVTPMMVGWNRAFNEGFLAAAQACAIPVRSQYRRINTYIYEATSPIVPPEEMEAQGKRTEERSWAP